MKTKAIVATLLIAAAASADARFAWPYPPKAVSPDEIGHWVVINGNAWSHDSAESELTTWNTRRGETSPSGGGLKSSPNKGKGRAQDWRFHSAWPASASCSPDSNALGRSRSSGSKDSNLPSDPRFKALIESSAVPAPL